MSDTVLWANDTSATLAAPITSAQTTIALTSGQGAQFPSPSAGQFFPVTLQSASNSATIEIVYCSSRSGDTLTVTRGEEGTTAQGFNAGDLVQERVTAGTLPQIPNGYAVGGALSGTLPNPSLASQYKFAHGECVFSRTGATSVKLSVENGCNIIINGVQYQIAASGVTASNAGVLVNGSSGNLAASTGYYVSLYSNSGTPTLAFWAFASYGHMPDTTAGNIGIEVISSSGTPNSAHTLVGYAQTDASGNFVDSATERWTRTWFNRNSVDLISSVYTASTSSTTPVELSSFARLSAFVWADENLQGVAQGFGSNNTAGASANATVYLDATTAIGPPSQATSAGVNQNNALSSSGVAILPGEGIHFITAFGFSSTTATTASFNIATKAQIAH